MFDWNKVTRKDMLLINQIAKRAKYFDPTLKLLSVQVDLGACHTYGCPLDLIAMLNADPGDLMYDIGGISRHLDRNTGVLGDCFVPRFAKREAAIA